MISLDLSSYKLGARQAPLTTFQFDFTDQILIEPQDKNEGHGLKP